MKGAALAMTVTVLLVGCSDQSMRQQKRYPTYGPAELWSDGTSARPIPPGVFAQSDEQRHADVETPPPITQAMIERGHERYNIYCSPCHGFDGQGKGMIVQRGFPSPPSYHSDRLRAAPAKYIFDVITDGYGVMYSYAARVPPKDRWAIVAYIRALQLSQQARLSEVPDAREKLP
jgi:mono/diheme cytochrome c family protein